MLNDVKYGYRFQRRDLEDVNLSPPASRAWVKPRAESDNPAFD